MEKKQLLALCICSLVGWSVGNGLTPLLPVYALQMGADPSVVGYYLAFSYIALAAGAIAAGWLSDRFNLRKIPLIIAGLISLPIAWLMGRVENIWGLSVLTALLWANGGLVTAMIGILAGMSAGENERGKIFGIIALTGGIGAVIGGVSTGYIVDNWGYATMFSNVAFFMILTPLAAVFLKEVEIKPAQGENGSTKMKQNLGKSYYLLFSASLVGSIAGFIILFGRSLLMSKLEFGALAISGTGAVGSLVSIPIPLLMGWLSDRTGRKIYLYLGYLACTASLAVLAIATSLWNFFIVLILQSLFVGINGTVGSALVTDLAPRESLGRGLSWFGATSWIGGVLGFASAGYAIQSLGTIPTFMIGICLTLIAFALIIPIRSKVNRYRTLTSEGNITL